MKKILIITGSFRKDGNTNTLVNAFSAGAIAAGNEVEIFDAARAKMDGCHADQSCKERGYCGQKDDGVPMNELMRWADVLVIASPLHWGGFTSYIKKAIDRFYQFSFQKGRETLSIKETYLICVSATPDDTAFNAMIAEFEHINEMLDFKCNGILKCNSLSEKEDIGNRRDYIEAAIRMGMNV